MRNSRTTGKGRKMAPGVRPSALFWGCALLLAAPLFLLSCATSTEATLSSVNAAAWAQARYEERCVALAGPKPACTDSYEALVRWRQRLAEAEKALSRGGSIKHQLTELKDAEKRAVRALPKEKP